MLEAAISKLLKIRISTFQIVKITMQSNYKYITNKRIILVANISFYFFTYQNCDTEVAIAGMPVAFVFTSRVIKNQGRQKLVHK